MLATLITSILGTILFLFIFWKRLKEDYISEIIFKIAFYILIGVLVLYLVSIRFFPSLFLWSSFVGALAGLAIGIAIFRIRFYEVLEALTISFLPWVGLMFLGSSVVNSSFSSFLAFIAILIIIFISYWLGDHYKNFTWYKSGKIGFTGLATLSIIFIVRSIVAIFGIRVLSFVGRYEVIVSATLAFICCLMLFNLGRDEV